MGSGLGLLQQSQQGLSDAQEVDHLGDAEQRGDDQRTTVRAFQEGRGALVSPDLPVKEWKVRTDAQPSPGQPCPSSWDPPGTVQKPGVSVLIDTSLK